MTSTVISPEARAVLDHDAGMLLVEGGPGSGKTTLLVERYASLVEGGVAADRIALFVLTRRTARRLRGDLIYRLRRSLPGVNVLTPYAFAYSVMGRRYKELGYAEPPVVLTADEQEATVRDLLAEEDSTGWPECGHLLGVAGFARQVARFVLDAQQRLLTPAELLAMTAGDAHAHEAARFYERYRDVLAAANRVDFAALLAESIAALQLGLTTEDRFEHLLVDDYQDAIPALEPMLAALQPAATTLVVAADLAGSVREHLGASPEPLARFPRDRVVVLPPGPGLDAGTLAALDAPVATPAAAAPGALSVEARLYAHPGEEADAIAHEMVRLRVDGGIGWGQMAIVLRRYGAMMGPLRQALARHGVPFVAGAQTVDVAREPSVEPLVTLIRFLARPDRRAAMLERVLTSPVVGMSPHDVRALRRAARAAATDALAMVTAGAWPAAATLTALMHDLAGRIDSAPAADLFWSIYRRLDYPAGLVERQEHRELDALVAFSQIVSRFTERRPAATICDLLDTLDKTNFLPSPAAPAEERYADAVTVLSAHDAQGRFFDVVVVAGCIEGEFPSPLPPQPLVGLPGATEADRSFRIRAQSWIGQERRLFRCAVTRARQRTIITASRSASATNPRTPSRFVEQRLGIAWEQGGSVVSGPTSMRALQSSLREEACRAGDESAARLAALTALAESGDDPSQWWGIRDWTGGDEPLFDDEMRTSYSRISSMQNCGLQYLYQSELGLDPEQSHAMWLGSMVHQIIDEAQRDVIPRAIEPVLARLDELWDPAQFPNRALEHRRRIDAEAMLRNWLAAEGGAEIVCSEIGFSYPIAGAVMRGKIDAIVRMNNGKLRIIDYKTSKSAISKEKVKTDLQLASYYLATTKVDELRELGEPGYLQLAFVFLKSQELPITLRDVKPSDVEPWAEAEITSLIERVRGEQFAPNPDADCQWCRFKPICPLWAQGRDAAR